MSTDKAISDHYFHGSLLASIQAALADIGKTTDTVSIEDLGPVDEFHIGGRPATIHFMDQLNFSEADHILDIGCGLGGAARFVADTYKCQVSGIDLAQEYIDTGNALCAWLKLDERISLIQGSALDTPYKNTTFDGAYMMHVGMNIEDKAQLFKEAYRVLGSGATLGVYDIMRQNEGELIYPVPWASDQSTSKLATIDQYKQALQDAGFNVASENSRRDFALEFFKAIRAATEAAGGPPPLGLHTLMKESTALKIKNMIENISTGLIAPVEIIARKP